MKSLTHPFPPFVTEKSTILILGSFPSVVSREEGFYYAHPQNRFYPLLAEVYHDKNPETIEEKKALLLRHSLALYDVISSCEITGSSDSSINAVVPSDLSWLPRGVKRILLNGKTAGKLFLKYQTPPPGMEVLILPSTSPANAQFSLARLIQEWGPFLLDN